MAAIQNTWELVTAVVVVLGLLGTGFGYIIYLAHKTFTKLTTTDTEARIKQEQDSHRITKQLLDQYREMYNIEKEKSERAIADLSNQINQLRQELDYLRSRLAEERAEVESLRALNLKLQQSRQGE